MISSVYLDTFRIIEALCPTVSSIEPQNHSKPKISTDTTIRPSVNMAHDFYWLSRPSSPHWSLEILFAFLFFFNKWSMGKRLMSLELGQEQRNSHWVRHACKNSRIQDVSTMQSLDLRLYPHLGQPWVLFNKLTFSKVVLCLSPTCHCHTLQRGRDHTHRGTVK